MALTNATKFVLGYLIFVGLPLAGLLVCLQYGLRLSAPASVDGIWRITAKSVEEFHLPCIVPQAPHREPSIAISQSGKYLSVSLSAGATVAANGTIAGREISVSGETPAGSNGSGCEKHSMLIVRATTDSENQPRSLEGVLSADGCAACAPVPFRAVRGRSERDGAH